MGARAVADAVVTRFCERLLSRMRVTALIWFGSRATGDFDRWSDYDFIVVSPEFEGVRFLDRADRLEELREDGASYDFLCYTPEEFQQLVSQITIVREAARTGVRLI
ncbi:MAG: nucleotidyltransferase domain-containing protein [Chloroflexi bacterium]|nr:nucleotidyltransferase domain-containing protein [Chloroflexota bacterium]